MSDAAYIKMAIDHLRYTHKQDPSPLPEDCYVLRAMQRSNDLRTYVAVVVHRPNSMVIVRYTYDESIDHPSTFRIEEIDNV